MFEPRIAVRVGEHTGPAPMASPLQPHRQVKCEGSPSDVPCTVPGDGVWASTGAGHERTSRATALDGTPDCRRAVMLSDGRSVSVFRSGVERVPCAVVMEPSGECFTFVDSRTHHLRQLTSCCLTRLRGVVATALLFHNRHTVAPFVDAAVLPAALRLPQPLRHVRWPLRWDKRLCRFSRDGSVIVTCLDRLATLRVRAHGLAVDVRWYAPMVSTRRRRVHFGRAADSGECPHALVEQVFPPGAVPRWCIAAYELARRWRCAAPPGSASGGEGSTGGGTAVACGSGGGDAGAAATDAARSGCFSEFTAATAAEEAPDCGAGATAAAKGGGKGDGDISAPPLPYVTCELPTRRPRGVTWSTTVEETMQFLRLPGSVVEQDESGRTVERLLPCPASPVLVVDWTPQAEFHLLRGPAGLTVQVRVLVAGCARDNSAQSSLQPAVSALTHRRRVCWGLAQASLAGSTTHVVLQPPRGESTPFVHVLCSGDAVDPVRELVFPLTSLPNPRRAGATVSHDCWLAAQHAARLQRNQPVAVAATAGGSGGGWASQARGAGDGTGGGGNVDAAAPKQYPHTLPPGGSPGCHAGADGVGADGVGAAGVGDGGGAASDAVSRGSGSSSGSSGGSHAASSVVHPGAGVAVVPGWGEFEFNDSTGAVRVRFDDRALLYLQPDDRFELVLLSGRVAEGRVSERLGAATRPFR